MLNKREITKDTFVYYAIEIYDSVSCDNFTYEVFKDKENAEKFLKENHKNPNAQVNKIVLKFKD